MKVDLYTKAILTVIAACLVVIVFKDISIVTPAQANTPANFTPSANTNYGLVPLNADGSMNVRVNNFDEYANDVNVRFNDELKVRITNSEIKTQVSSAWRETFKVKIEQ
ncbi:hypothetical protein [Myroides odoratimimus]|uniref:hypothetical protein n=1 Tax=Myroides odoratimimus TaxID=76832 RepID=UPI002576E72F|nr:hypothetical protein [Myroides odoratimimus]MDM1395616.1 hypothetical protein [Myroides odoratimimus]MDM1530689.1 hypothetical protein [Myroides odoratimimus]